MDETIKSRRKSRNSSVAGYKRSRLKELLDSPNFWVYEFSFNISPITNIHDALYVINRNKCVNFDYYDELEMLASRFKIYFNHYTETLYEFNGRKYILRQARCSGRRFCKHCGKRLYPQAKSYQLKSCEIHKGESLCPITLFFLYYPKFENTIVFI